MIYSTLISPDTRYHRLQEPLELEGGGGLDEVRVAYRSWGRLNRTGDNAVLVCHALTGSADVDRWWGGLLGPGRALDPERDFVVASNVLGGCYGTTGPGTPVPGAPGGWGPDFPGVTIRDQVRAQALLLEALGVRRISLVVGGSMGGMQALEWGVMEPLPVDTAAVIGAPARHSPWAIGLGEVQRRAILDDPSWRGGWYDPDEPPAKGLALARSVAMCSYRSPGSFDLRFRRELNAEGAFEVESYLRYQGRKLGDRFDANSYLLLSRAMDSHDLARGRSSLSHVLEGIRPRTLVVGIRSDVLYLPEEVERLAADIPEAELCWIDSPHGHDAFLMEQEFLSGAIRSFRIGAGLRAAGGRTGYRVEAASSHGRCVGRGPSPAAGRRVLECGS